MPRWIIPAGAVAILISLAALGISLANSASAPEDVNATQQTEEQEPEQEASPQPTEQQETGQGEATRQEEPTTPGEQTVQGGQTTPQGAPAPGPELANIQITGDAAYYCSAGAIGAPETVEGQSPASYEVEVETGGTALDTVMAACQKISPGTLGVRILYDDEVVAEDETSARLGTVSVSWNPLEGE